MKKFITIAVSLTLLTVLLVGCGGSRFSDDEVTYLARESNNRESPNEWDNWDNGSGEFGDWSDDSVFENSEPGQSSNINLTRSGNSLASRVIYTAYVEMESLDFDETVAGIYEMLENVGGFIETSNVRGNAIDASHRRMRDASFVLRIPQSDLGGVLDGFEQLGNVVSIRRDSENVTTQFIDTQSRVAALRIQEERLMYMLSQTTRISDMMDIESRVSEVRFEIERYTSRLMNLEAQVAYSTLTLNVFEVFEYSEVEPEYERSYWQAVGEDFVATLNGVGMFFAGAFRIFVVASPVVVLVVLAVVGVVILDKKNKKRRTKKIAETLSSEKLKGDSKEDSEEK